MEMKWNEMDKEKDREGKNRIVKEKEICFFLIKEREASRLGSFQARS